MSWQISINDALKIGRIESCKQWIWNGLTLSTINSMGIFEQFTFKANRTSTDSATVESKPYATAPNNLSSKEYGLPKPSVPQFCNMISLKTMEHNLLLQFGFVQSLIAGKEATQPSSNSTIVLSSDTAKQLFCALAELFDCEIQPKS